MKLRTLIIVAVALAIVTMAGYYIRNASLTTPEDDPLVGTNLIDQDMLTDVTRIEISKEDEKAILELADGKWTVRSLYDLPVDFGKLNTLIRNLVDAEIQRKITSREDRLARLDLTQGTIEFYSADNKRALSLTFGKSLPGGGKSFMFGTEKTAFLASTSPFIDASSNNWAQKMLYEFEADEVAGIQFFLEDESWAVRRDDKDKDFVSTTPNDERTPRQSEITSLINRFTNLRFTEVVERSEEEATDTWKGAQDNSRSLKVTLFSGETITIKMAQWEPPEPEEGEEADPPSSVSNVTYLHLSSSQADHPINSLMDRLAFKASSYTFSGIPVQISEVADLPEEEQPEEAADEAVTAEDVSEALSETQDQASVTQPEIKQHIDGNSVVFEVVPPEQDEGSEDGTDDEASATEPAETP